MLTCWERTPPGSRSRSVETKWFARQDCHSKGIIIRDLKMGKFVFVDKERRVLCLGMASHLMPWEQTVILFLLIFLPCGEPPFGMESLEDLPGQSRR
jgi:hypothetical protein